MTLTEFIKNRIVEDYGSVRRFAGIVGIPTSTLNTALNKKNGFNTMAIEKAVKVCNELGLDLETLYDMEKTIPPNKEEQHLIKVYERLTKRSKDVVMRTAEDLLDIETNKTTLILPIVDQKEKIQELDYYDQAAGMGTGQIVDNPIPEKMKLLSSQVPDNADFVIRVYGDSMEPTYHSNDKLFIQKTHVLDVGDIGVFSFNGEQLVKEYGIGKLISHNSQYPPIKIDENVFIQGKVVGKV